MSKAFSLHGPIPHDVTLVKANIITHYAKKVGPVGIYLWTLLCYASQHDDPRVDDLDFIKHASGLSTKEIKQGFLALEAQGLLTIQRLHEPDPLLQYDFNLFMNQPEDE